MKTQTCNVCNETKDVEMFSVRYYRGDGSPLYRRYCKQCRNKKDEKYQAHETEYARSRMKELYRLAELGRKYEAMMKEQA